jgi:hypothetical protein
MLITAAYLTTIAQTMDMVSTSGIQATTAYLTTTAT